MRIITVSMFDNYENIPSDYIPNNSTKKLNNEYYSIVTRPPYPIYNVKDNLVGYYWRYGDTLDLYFDADNVITVHEDSIIYDNTSDTPSINTVGYIGQQAFNTYDAISWTCTDIKDDLYIWTKDDRITYPVNGTKKIRLNTSAMYDDVLIEVYNFRWELFHVFDELDKDHDYCSIDEELSKKFKPGIYYFIMRVKSSGTEEIKKKIMFAVK